MNKIALSLRVFGLALAFAGFSTAASAAADISAGQATAGVCAGCHGMDGNSFNPAWPKLAAQHPGYLVKQLADFKAGDRTNAIMAPMAMGLSPQDMENVAAYFAAQKKSAGNADASGTSVGELIYRSGNLDSGVTACTACHGADAAGNPAAGFPVLGSQHAAYTQAQLKAFASGERSNDSAKMMQMIASKLTDAEIQAVAAYIEGLK
ncbi:MAG: cytochrome c4 [Gammaproteobacteria bacterium]|nr:cytochrome c4 [Gammaproteobacteria bacterium]